MSVDSSFEGFIRDSIDILDLGGVPLGLPGSEEPDENVGSPIFDELCAEYALRGVSLEGIA